MIKLLCECMQVVSDILSEFDFLTDIKSRGKITHLDYSAGLNSNYIPFF